MLAVSFMIACQKHVPLDMAHWTSRMFVAVYKLDLPLKDLHVILYIIFQTPNEPRCEKTGFLHMRNQLCGNRTADQRLCFRYIDGTIPLLSKSKILSLYPSSVHVQPGLCQTWSETPKTGFVLFPTPNNVTLVWLQSHHK